MNKLWTLEEELQLKDLYRFAPQEDLEALFNTTWPRIKDKAKKLGNLNRQKAKVNITELINDYNTGMKVADIWSKHNITNPTLLKLLRENNIPKRNRTLNPILPIKTWLEEITSLTFTSTKDADLYNDDLKVGINYCILKDCNESKGCGQKYNYTKYTNCKNNNIHLITIFEDEWINRNKQVKGAILSMLGKNSRIFYARKCEVRIISKDMGNAFYDENHIQGKSFLSFVFVGLYFNNELLGVMSFGKHHRDIGKFVLDRLCFKYDVNVTGGASKLFKFLLNHTGITELISWSDCRWFSGGVYPKLGFVLEDSLDADYSYVNINSSKIVRLSKQSQKKGNTNCPAGLTEKQWSIQNGLYRIWDVGKLRWVYKKIAEADKIQ